ncbi:DUF859 family phage minor structural protein [Streptococcus suis]|uniref:DUF859 family phage minor structural protein n=1 Tax=Streptococcus suis TaxID=1307 RepID=UPI0025AF4518|nr:DUF859 family phage minor structural protein [Streptococcus suis]MDN2970459.1 DUF859 family phage minor structural protein [Streptococcus suis]
MARYSNTSNSLHLNVYIDQASQNIAANSSTVNWRVTVSRTGNYYTYNQSGDSTLIVTIDGVQVHSSNPRWATSGEEVQLASGSRTISHNADGSKSVSISANFNPNNGIHGRIITSGNLGLTTIPRSSSVSVGSGVIGSAVTININRQSSSFKHKVRYVWGNKSGTIASNVDTSTTWTIPLDFANDIPNSTSGTGTIYVDTYSGSIKTGTQSTTFTASVPTSMKPTFTGITLADHNTAAQSLIPGNTFIQVISNIKVTFNGGAGSYGSTITGYKAEIVGKNQTTNVNGGTLGIMNYNGTITVRASVSDSRGRWSDTRDVTVTVLEYFAPALSFSIARTGSTSSTLTVTRNARVAPLTVGGAQKNTMTLSFKVARLGTTTYTADTGPATGSWTSLASLTNSQANLSGTYAANQSWVVIGTLADKFTQTEFAVNVATESVVFSYDRSGVGVNKIRERGALDVNGDIYANGQQIQQYSLFHSTHGGKKGGNITDMDAIVDNGYYYCSANAVGNPFNSWGTVFHFNPDGNSNVNRREAIQLFFINSGKMAIRHHRDTTLIDDWESWKEFVTTDHPLLQEKPLKTLTMGFPYSMKANLVRKGDVVTISIIRNIYSVDSFEHAVMQEKIPAGYRPVVDVHMTVNTNVSQFTKSPNILHFAPDGTIRMTSNTVGGHVMTGTITYITNDPYPS